MTVSGGADKRSSMEGRRFPVASFDLPGTGRVVGKSAAGVEIVVGGGSTAGTVDERELAGTPIKLFD